MIGGAAVGLTQYLGSLVRGWYLLVIGLLLGGALAVGYLQVTHPVYTSNTQLFVSTTTAGDVATAAAGVTLSEERTASYVQLVGGRELAAMVIDDLGLDMTTDDLMSEISASALAETVIVNVDVTDPSPTRAQAIATAIGTEFADLVTRIETPAGSSAPTLQVSVVAAPELPTEPSSPDVLLVLAAGLLGGLVLGGVVAVVRDRLDTSVRDDETAAEASGAPVLGLVPDVEDVDTLADGLPSSSPVTEAFQAVRTNLQFVSVGSKPRVLMVTSADQAEGKTTTAIRLAQTLAGTGQRVLLVEADVRRPRITKYLGAISGAGLTNVLVETAGFDDVVQSVGEPGLDLLAAGPLPPNPSELLGGEGMRHLLAELSARYDVVLVDAPPLLPVADSVGMSALVDGVLLCVRWGTTSHDRLARARALLDRADAVTLGGILTFVPRKASGQYQYDYADRVEETRPRRRWRRRRTVEVERSSPAKVAAARERPARASAAGATRSGAVTVRVTPAGPGTSSVPPRPTLS